VALSVLVLVGCGDAATTDNAERDASGAIVASGAVGTQALRVGDCFDEPEDDRILVVTGVPCRDAHDAQMTARIAVDDGEWPGVDALTAEASPSCNAAPPSLSAAAPAVALSAYLPDERSWDEGDRDIVCLIESADGASLFGDLLAGS